MQNLPSVGGATAGCVGFAQSIPGTTNGPQWLSGDLLKSVKSQVGQGLAGKYQAAITNAIGKHIIRLLSRTFFPPGYHLHFQRCGKTSTHLLVI